MVPQIHLYCIHYTHYIVNYVFIHMQQCYHFAVDVGFAEFRMGAKH